MSAGLLVLSAFLASAVEMVEALTIVLAAGIACGWRSALMGVGAAIVVLAAIVAALGPALAVIPIDALRLAVGSLLLVFGLQWLRKAILRASGYKALHDEDAIFARELEEARHEGSGAGRRFDSYGFTLSFKGVLLEGLEVAFIVLTFGTTQGRIGLAVLGAGAAVVLVAGIGIAVRELLGGGGCRRALAGRRRLAARRDRLHDRRLGRAREPVAPPPRAVGREPGDGLMIGRISSFGRFWWDFVVGDDWMVSVQIAVAIAATAGVAAAGVSAWWLLPLAVIGVLYGSLLRATRG